MVEYDAIWWYRYAMNCYECDTFDHAGDDYDDDDSSKSDADTAPTPTHNNDMSTMMICEKGERANERTMLVKLLY